MPARHMLKHFFSTIIPLLIFASSLCSCVKTELEAKSLSAIEQALSASNPKQLYLDVQDLSEQETLGHQYLIFMVPFGRIVALNKEELLKTAFSRNLALKGFSLKSSPAPAREVARSSQEVAPHLPKNSNNPRN